MWQIYKLAILTYFILLCTIILIVPPYGDPAIVIWTSKVMSITGFSYDPVCSKNIMSMSNSHEILLCVRSPLYYLLLAIADGFYKIIPLALATLFFGLQIILARLNGSSLNVFGLMFPSIYLLFSRTYVDTLTTTLMTSLLIILMKINKENRIHHKALLFSIPLLLMLARESFVALPLFLIIIFLIVPKLGKKNLLIVFTGWVVGVVSWQLYVVTSGGVSYSDFQPHIPTLGETYRAFMTTITPILPWEIRSEDIQAYLNISLADSFILLVITIVHFLGLIAVLPLIISLAHFKQISKLVLGQAVFGLLMSAGLLLLKGEIDFFRHLAYLLPVIPLLIEIGLRGIQRHSRLTANLIRVSYVLMFTLYFVRAIRLYTSGYSFDPCQYLLKRPEISSISYFYETACS